MMIPSHARFSQDQPLNITSLMDILTIVLIFLIMNFSTEENEVQLPAGLTLPVSTSEREVQLSFRIAVAGDGIFMGDKRVVELNDGALRSDALGKDGEIVALLAALQRARAAWLRGDVVEGAAGPPPTTDEAREILFLEADEATAYNVLQKAMYTASMAGFTKFRLAVRRES